jgi:hypothetical protein
VHELQPGSFHRAAPGCGGANLFSETWRPPLVDGIRHDLFELSQIEWLGEDGEKSFAQGDLIPGDEDYWHGDIGAPQGIENVPPREAWHHHVEENGVRLDGRHGVERFRTIPHYRDIVALAGEEVAQQLEDVWFVIGD